MEFAGLLARCRAIIDPALDALFAVHPPSVAPAKSPKTDLEQQAAAVVPPERLLIACRESLAGGKRLRPYLMLSVAQMLNLVPTDYIKAACAVECVHTSSLILDDLPSMDDAKERRGRPTLHKRFDEATAILAAISLLMRGFELLAENASQLRTDDENATAATATLARCIGIEGMTAGQMIDLTLHKDSATLETMTAVATKKTAQLFVAAGTIPVLLSRKNPRDLAAVEAFSRNIGIAYQIADDIADNPKSDPRLPSYPAKSASNPSSFASALTPANAKATANELIDAALSHLRPYGTHAQPLRLLAEYISSRV